MGCCGNGSHGKSNQSHANSGSEKKGSWMFWIMTALILGLLILSVLR